MISKQVIEELLAEGNGASVYVPQPGGKEWKVSYLWGKFRVDVAPRPAKIPVPETGGGGGEIAPP